MPESKPVTDWHGETPATAPGVSLIIRRLSFCLLQTDRKQKLRSLPHLFPPPICCICRLVFILSPPCFLFYAAFFCLSLFVCLSPAAFVCLSLFVFIPLFLWTRWPCSGAQCWATDLFGWRCWWLNGVRDLPNDCLEQQPQGHKTKMKLVTDHLP